MEILEKILIIFFLLIFSNINIFPQTQLSLSFSQTAVEDWKQGKRLTFEISNSLDSKLNFKIDTLCVQINLKYDIGLLLDKSEKNEKDHLMPTDNNLFGEIVLKYPLNFGTFEDMTKWTIDFDNEFQIKIWKWFGVLAKIKVFYDESKSLNTQYNQSPSYQEGGVKTLYFNSLLPPLLVREDRGGIVLINLIHNLCNFLI